MWQKRVENVHYSVFMKIEFKAENIAIRPCQRESRVSALAHPRDEIWSAINTIHLIVIPCAIFVMSAKSN